MPKSRSPLRAVWPLAVVLVIAAAWCLYWYIGWEKAKQSFADYVEKNARAGIEIDCADALWGGFPFRFELRCASLAARGARGSVDIDFAAGPVAAVALAYNPFHLIVELDGPVTLALTDRADQRFELASRGRPLRASIAIATRPNRADQVSLEARDQSGTVNLTEPEDATTPAVPFTLDRLVLHTRYAAPPVDEVAPFDVAAGLEGLVYGPDRSTLFGAEPLRIETASLDANITALPYRGGQKFSQRAKAWQQGDGVLTVRRLGSVSNFLTGTGKGALRLDDKGLLNGKLEWRVSGFNDLMTRLLNAGLIEEKAATAADTILNVLGEPESEGDNPGIGLKTILKEGKLYFGPFRVSTIKPLF